jgi:cobalt-zinc-cadmium efflux system outer membrane protein
VPDLWNAPGQETGREEVRSPLRLAIVLGTTAISGCATVDPGAAFIDVSNMVRERSGQDARFMRSPTDAQETSGLVRELLKDELTADAAARVALVNNRELQATLQDLGVAQADLAQAGRISNPDFHGFLRFPDREPKGKNYEVSLFQDFLDILIRPLRKKFAAAQLEATKLIVGDALIRTMAEAKRAFFTLAAREQLATRLVLIVDIERTAAAFARRQSEAGNINNLQLLNHEASASEAEMALALTRIEARRDRERLNRLMGLWGPDLEWKMPSGLPRLPEQEISTKQLESFAISNRLDIESARWGVETVGRALALKQKTRYSPLGIEVGIQHEKDTDGQRVTGPSLSLQLPIFDTGKASIARLKAEYERAQRQLEGLAINTRSEVREARDAMLAAREVKERYETVLLPQRVRILEETTLHYNMMLKGVYDLLLAKQAEVLAERGYVDAWRDYWLARTELERALGGRLPSPDPAAKDTHPEGAAIR